MRPLRIDIVSDVVCPWCYIGDRRVELALRELPDVAATVTYHPFQLDPGTPPEGADLRERLRRKYGVDPEQMFGRVEEAARESGLQLDFSRVRRSVNTLRAHTLLRHAEPRGTQRQLAQALFAAYFVEGRDVGAEDVLVQLAAAQGFGEDEAAALLRDEAEAQRTREEAQAAARQGVSGVPFTVLNQRYALSGAQPVAVFRQAMERALADTAAR